MPRRSCESPKKLKSGSPPAQPTVILGLDIATATGWCVLIHRDNSWLYYASGVAKSAQHRVDVVTLASKLANELGGPVRAFMEISPEYGRPKVIAALARSRGAWEQCLYERGIVDLVSLRPLEWRQAVMGLPSWTPRLQAKQAAIEWAQRTVHWSITRDDEAEGGSACSLLSIAAAEIGVTICDF